MLAKLSRCFSIASIGLALGAVAGFDARAAQMSAPVVGLIGGESASPGGIRPVLGVMGASSIQAPIRLPREISRVYLAPTGRWALVQQSRRAPGPAAFVGSRPATVSRKLDSTAAQLGLVAFTGSEPGVVQAIAGAAPNPSLVSFSPLGKSAGLLASSKAIQVLTGLDSAPGWHLRRPSPIRRA